MGLWLKQSTSVTVKIGPFIDDTDGKTAETGLTLTQADIRLSKNSGDIAQKHESTSASTDELGYYDCPLDDTDTNTLGILQLFVHESGALPVFHEFMIVPTNVWDSLFSTDRLQVDVRELGDSTLALTTQMKADVNTEVDSGLDTAVPGSPTANSINERMKTLDDNYTLTRAGYLDNINNANLATIPAISAARIGYLDNINQAGLLQVTAARAGYLDNLSAGAVALASGVTVTTNNDKTGYELSATGVDSVWDEVAEGTLTVRQLLRLYQSALAGKSAGGGTATLTFQDNADSKARITATVDADGNRTAVTLDAT